MSLLLGSVGSAADDDTSEGDFVLSADTTDPTIDSPRDIFLPKGSTIIITWTADDLNKKNYTIFVDGSPIYEDTWTSTTIQYDLTTFNTGTYNVTCLVYDDAENSAWDDVQVIITLPAGGVGVNRGGGGKEEIGLGFVLIILLGIFAAVIGSIYLITTLKKRFKPKAIGR